MHRQIQLTADGSHTISIPELGVTYHSHHGAIQESMHVFLQAALIPTWKRFSNDPIRILEIGFGTGLNALLTLREAVAQQRVIHYTAIEKYPLTAEEAGSLNHGQLLGMNDLLGQLHTENWDQLFPIDPFFSLHKINLSLPSPILIEPVHCIYFDAFAPDIQPALWDQAFFETLFRLLIPGGYLATYSSKSAVRRALTAAGFVVHKIPGPFGKREMVRAEKL